MKRFKQESYILLGACSAAAIFAFAVVWGRGDSMQHVVQYPLPSESSSLVDGENALPAAVAEPVKLPPPVHIATPDPVRGIYMTSWVAGTPSFRKNLIELADSSEINTIVIDVKDYTGKVAFKTGDQKISAVGSEEDRVPDMRSVLEDLHQRNIYTIARISVFQDPHFAKMRPKFAVHRGDGEVWKDRKGLSWMDPASKEVWDYNVAVAEAAARAGFDELNFDYVRFPSDGNLTDITYPVWDEKKPKSDVIAEFFAYLNKELEDTNVPISADLFGFVTSNMDDLNIGQILEKIAPHVDYIAPMVYPSHYPDNYNGYANPAAHPYEIIFKAMTDASGRLNTLRSLTASSTSPFYGKEIAQLRPWLQDFDLGATYTAEMIQKEHQAVYDASLQSWMMWDPKNIYTREAYRPE